MKKPPHFLLNLWRVFRRRKKIRQVRLVQSMNDLPVSLGADLFIVEKAGVPRWAVLDCPCLCGSRIDVNLMTSSKPHWQIVRRSGRVTIRPSLWQPCHKCGSHFLIANNKILWVSEKSKGGIP